MNETTTRRTAIKIGGATVLAPAFAQVTTAATDSGNVEINTTSTIPADTSIDIRLYEDTSGNGTEDRSQSKSLVGGTETLVYDALQGFEGQQHTYWAEISLAQNTGGSSTPELDSMEIVLPAEEPTGSGTQAEPRDRKALDGILDSGLGFIAGTVMAFLAIGLGSKSMALASWGGYLAFAYFAINSGYALLENILYVTLVLIFIGFAFKFWRLEGMGE